MSNSADLDQLAPSEANVHGSTLFAKTEFISMGDKTTVRTTVWQEISDKLLCLERPIGVDKFMIRPICLYSSHNASAVCEQQDKG